MRYSAKLIKGRSPTEETPDQRARELVQDILTTTKDTSVLEKVIAQLERALRRMTITRLLEREDTAIDLNQGKASLE